MVVSFFFIVAICIVHAAIALPRRPWFELSVLVLLTYLGFSAVRFLPTASFTLTVLAVGLAAQSRFLADDARLEELRILSRGLSGCVAAGAAGYAVWVA